jgi:hypothetical protein
MQNITKFYTYLSTQKVQTTLNPFAVFVVFVVFVAICFLVISGGLAFAGEDILRGTDANLIATLNGSGKKYIYLVEGFLSLAMYIKTKNMLVLFGIVVVAVFFNIILKVAGV